MLRKQYFILTIAIAVLVVLSGLLVTPVMVKADPVKAEHRVCEQDSQCSVINIGCSCCGSGDRAFHYDAVNISFKEQYAELGLCTKEQKARCASADCEITKAPIAKCKANSCVAEMNP